MIVKDKRAYIFENLYGFINQNSFSIQQYHKGKYYSTSAVGDFNLEGFDDTGIESTLNKLFEINKLLRVTIINNQDSKFTFKEIFRNKEIYDQFLKREDFLELDLTKIESLIKNSTKEVLIGKFIKSKNKAFRYISLLPKKNSEDYYLLEFMVDDLFLNLFGNKAYQIIIADENGKTLYSNKKNTNDFLRELKSENIFNLNKKLKNDTEKKGRIKSRVFEKEVLNKKNIIGIRSFTIKGGGEYFLIASILTKDAYSVTIVLILRTVAILVAFLALINIIVILFIKKIVFPLNKLGDVMKIVSDGNYTVVVDEQKFFELNNLATSFNTMLEKVNLYSEQLKEINQNLEDRVRERTASLKEANDFIKAVVDSVDQGIAVINKEKEFLPLYSKSSETLLGENIEDRPIHEVLKVSKRDPFERWLDNLFLEKIPFDSIVNLGPKEIPFDESENNFQVITLNYFPIRDEEGGIRNIVLLATDKTKEVMDKKEIEVQVELVGFLTHVAKRSDSFFKSMKAFKLKINEMIKEFETTTDNFALIEKLKLNIHSLKGEVGFYNMTSLVNYIHDFESEIEKYQNKEPIEGFSFVQNLKNILDMIAEKEEIVFNQLGLGEEKNSFSSVLWKKVDDFIPNVKDLKNDEFLKSYKIHFYYESIKENIYRYNDLITKISKELDKKVDPLIIEGSNLKTTPNIFDDFYASLQHIFRNIIDHGIERAEQRISLGKSESGKIKVLIEDSNSDGVKLMRITIEDDGQGIDPKKVKDKLASLGYPKDVLDKEDKEIINYIFEPNFSTKEKASIYSGRGVGLAEVKEELNKLGGTIEVYSEIRKGTKFIITF